MASLRQGAADERGSGRKTWCAALKVTRARAWR